MQWKEPLHYLPLVAGINYLTNNFLELWISTAISPNSSSYLSSLGGLCMDKEEFDLLTEKHLFVDMWCNLSATEFIIKRAYWSLKVFLYWYFNTSFLISTNTKNNNFTRPEVNWTPLEYCLLHSLMLWFLWRSDWIKYCFDCAFQFGLSQ